MTRRLTFILAAALSIIDPAAALPAGATPVNQMAIDGAAFDRAFVDQLIKQEQEEAVALVHVQADDNDSEPASTDGRS